MWFDWKRCLIYKRSFNCRSNYFSVVFSMFFFSVPLFLRQNSAKLMWFEHVRASACDTLQNHLVTFFSFIRNFLLVHLSHRVRVRASYSLVTLIDPICWCSRDSCSFFISVLLCIHTHTHTNAGFLVQFFTRTNSHFGFWQFRSIKSIIRGAAATTPLSIRNQFRFALMSSLGYFCLY